ncbi:unnamed protein product [Moneuplotes crassus]|uniref:Uncharacterized protein n=1 Tax=Euplotes crassus TaxID=5936 RepID=A0AAD2D880_EUPCR|nr:unnamed protein product [Moneuplotes crassus]
MISIYCLKNSVNFIFREVKLAVVAYFIQNLLWPYCEIVIPKYSVCLLFCN